MLRLKLFLKKVGLSQPSFRVIFESEKNKKKKKLLLLDDDGDSRIKNPDANDNRTFGLVSDDDYPNSRCPKCTILTIYYNNNNNNNYNSSENNVDNIPPGRNNKNNVIPRFIGHPNGIVFRVFNK